MKSILYVPLIYIKFILRDSFFRFLSIFLFSCQLRNHMNANSENNMWQSNRRTIMDDPFIRNYIEDLLKNIRTQVLLKLIKPYTRIRIPFISKVAIIFICPPAIFWAHHIHIPTRFQRKTIKKWRTEQHPNNHSFVRYAHVHKGTRKCSWFLCTCAFYECVHYMQCASQTNYLYVHVHVGQMNGY